MTKEPFTKLLDELKLQINNQIFLELSKRKPKSLYAPLNYFLKSGGKRLRGILVLLVAKSINKNLKSLPLNQAIAIELLHNFTLIHDDIMDNSDKRHNKPTLHRKYDLSTAILAGDALLSIAYEFLDKELTENSMMICKEFTSALRIVCEGQALDKEFETRNRVSLQQYFQMISMKTGALIKSACKIGALSANKKVGIEDLKRFGEYGEYLGIAFQLQDDLLDIVGEQKLFGKTKALDLIEGKKTFLLISALKKATGKDLDRLLKLIENKGIKPDEIYKYIDIYKNLGIIELTKKEISKYYQKAKDTLEILNKKYDINDLNNFLEFVINRNY